MKIAATISIFCLIFLCGCPKEDTGDGIVEIGINFEWDLENLDRSPEIRLQNVPEMEMIIPADWRMSKDWVQFIIDLPITCKNFQSFSDLREWQIIRQDLVDFGID